MLAEELFGAVENARDRLLTLRIDRGFDHLNHRKQSFVNSATCD